MFELALNSRPVYKKGGYKKGGYKKGWHMGEGARDI